MEEADMKEEEEEEEEEDVTPSATASRQKMADPYDSLDAVAKEFLGTMWVDTAEKLLQTRKNDIAHEYAYWRKEEGLVERKDTTRRVNAWKAIVREAAIAMEKVEIAAMKPDSKAMRDDEQQDDTTIYWQQPERPSYFFNPHPSSVEDIYNEYNGVGDEKYLNVPQKGGFRAYYKAFRRVRGYCPMRGMKYPCHRVVQGLTKLVEQRATERQVSVSTILETLNAEWKQSGESFWAYFHALTNSGEYLHGLTKSGKGRVPFSGPTRVTILPTTATNADADTEKKKNQQELPSSSSKTAERTMSNNKRSSRALAASESNNHNQNERSPKRYRAASTLKEEDSDADDEPSSTSKLSFAEAEKLHDAKSELINIDLVHAADIAKAKKDKAEAEAKSAQLHQAKAEAEAKTAQLHLRVQRAKAIRELMAGGFSKEEALETVDGDIM